MDHLYRDRRNIPFADYRQWLPSSVHDWATPERVTKDVERLQQRFHDRFMGKPCWWCGEDKIYERPVPHHKRHELHHLCAGSVGRSHETYLFTYLCGVWGNDCHGRHVTDWADTAIRYGRFLPELITD